MKNLLLITLFLVALPFSQTAQDNKIILRIEKRLSGKISDSLRNYLLDSLSNEYGDISPEKSEYYNRQAFELAVKRKDTDLMAVINNRFGSIEFYKGNYDSALHYFLKAEHFTRVLDHPHKLSSLYNNIGNVYISQKNLVKALEYYREALKLDEKHDIKDQTANDHQNIGAVFVELGQHDSAQKHLLYSLKLAEEGGFNETIIQSYSNLGSIESEKGNTQKALDYFLRSYKMSKEFDDTYGLIINGNNIAGCYIKLNKNAEAEVFAMEALKLSKEIGALDDEKNSYEHMAAICAARKDFERAYDFHLRYSSLKDSVYTMERMKEVTEMNARYDAEKKELDLLKKDSELKQKSAEEKQRSTERNMFIAGSLVFALAAIFTFRSSLIRKRKNEIIALQKQEVEKQKALVDLAYSALHEKNKEILDSINYARRIQRALLTTEKYVDRTLTRLKLKN